MMFLLPLVLKEKMHLPFLQFTLIQTQPLGLNCISINGARLVL